MLKFFGFALACLVMCSQSTCWAQTQVQALGGPSSTPNEAPEPPGSIINNTTEAPPPTGQIKSWISRFGAKSAVALSLRGDTSGALVQGTLRQYEDSGDGLAPLVFKIDPKIASTSAFTDEVDVIPIKLDAINDPLLRYPAWEIVYDDREPTIFTKKINVLPVGQKYVLGWVTFKPGSVSRDKSTVTIRLDRTKVKPRNPSPSTDPCAGPPTDDIGEEEQLSSSAKYGNQSPASNLPPQP